MATWIYQQFCLYVSLKLAGWWGVSAKNWGRWSRWDKWRQVTERPTSPRNPSDWCEKRWSLDFTFRGCWGTCVGVWVCQWGDQEAHRGSQETRREGGEPAEHKLIQRWLSAGKDPGGQRRWVSLEHSLCNSGKSLTWFVACCFGFCFLSLCWRKS